jgi:hypothetical protein
MGRLCTSFEEAWNFCLRRQEDPASFFAQFREEPSYLLGWLLRLADDACASAVEVARQAFSQVEWVTPQPRHFLHTWIGGVALAPRRPTPGEIEVAVGRAQPARIGIDSFAVRYRRINCLHSAVVVEVEGEGPRHLATTLVESRYWNELPIAGRRPAFRRRRSSPISRSAP